jgi:hypothetical protein
VFPSSNLEAKEECIAACYSCHYTGKKTSALSNLYSNGTKRENTHKVICRVGDGTKQKENKALEPLPAKHVSASFGTLQITNDTCTKHKISVVHNTCLVATQELR